MRVVVGVRVRAGEGESNCKDKSESEGVNIVVSNPICLIISQLPQWVSPNW